MLTMAYQLNENEFHIDLVQNRMRAASSNLLDAWCLPITPPPSALPHMPSRMPLSLFAPPLPFVFFPFILKPSPSPPPLPSTSTLSHTHATSPPQSTKLLASLLPTHVLAATRHSHKCRTHAATTSPFLSTILPSPHLATTCLAPHGATPRHATS
jgi:hypothetical protein